MAYNEATGETDSYNVTATHAHEDPITVNLTVGGELLETTPEHPFYTVDEEWVAAGELEVGDDIRRADGSYGEVEAIEFIHQPQVMYNLTVDEAHTFFVGDGQWLVHNTCELVFDSNGEAIALRGGVPGLAGLRVPRLLTPQEMANIARSSNLPDTEFGLAQEQRADGTIGDYWLFSGVYEGSIEFPEIRNGNNIIPIYHTHPFSVVPSVGDLNAITVRAMSGPVTREGIIPLIEPDPARVAWYYPNTVFRDYLHGGKHYQPRR